MQNPCSQFQESFLDDTLPRLTDAVIKQKIKPTIIVQNQGQWQHNLVAPTQLFKKKKISSTNDTIKVK
jgi:hypothetical protein